MNRPLAAADAAKFAAAKRASELVETGMKVGLGTGSTAAWLVRALAARQHEEGLRFQAVPTSTQTASGGVGSAAIQLAKLRGATIIAQCSPDKASALKELGAEHTVNRHDDLIQVLGMNSVDAVVDLVGGKSWPHLLELLKPGGRYVVSGAIAGPIVDLDLRNLYLKDLTLYGSTVNDPYVFENVIRYIEEGQIKPLVSQSFPLQDIKKAQNVFMEKKFIGKLVLVP